MVARLAGAFLAIFDGSCRTIADAGHALCAVGSPDGTGVLQCDVIQRAELFAFAAADADIACSKGICLHKQRIENRVHRAARDAVEIGRSTRLNSSHSSQSRMPSSA